MDRAEDADWYFFLDADDIMLPNALAQIPHTKALFGSVMTIRLGIIREDRPVGDWDDLFSGGIAGTISMGAFFSAREARSVRFHEGLDRGEDFEFYLAFLSRHGFTKIGRPLVIIGDDVPSAAGPRGYAKLDWQLACLPFWEFWRDTGRRPISQEERNDLVRQVTSNA
jgi:hypothetical protein